MFEMLGLGLQVAGLVSGAFGARNQSKADEAAYKYQAALARNNAQIAEWQARDAITRGQTLEQTQRLKTAQAKGSQRAAFAARGVALDEGSPRNILDDTDYMGELDALTIRDNAAREAWGHRVQAANYGSESSLLKSRADAENPTGAAFSSLLTGAGALAASRSKSRADAENPTGAAFSSLLTGAGAVADTWYRRGAADDYTKSLQITSSQYGWN